MLAKVRAMLSRIRGMLERRRFEREFDEEARAHLAMLEGRFLRQGMNAEEAHYAARRQFGGLTQLRDNLRERRSLPQIETFSRDVQYAFRQLRKAPTFTLAAILVVALGIGATIALFAVVRSVLLKPLPFKEPARLVRLYEQSSDGKFPYNVIAGGVFEDWKKQSHGFTDLAILLSEHEYNLSGAGGQLPEKVRATQCSWNLFPILGVEPALGRGFTAADDQPSANATVVLSWGLWKRRFGGDPAILNQTIHLDGKAYTVIGVMPSWFAYPAQHTQLWTPVYHERPTELMRSLTAHMFVVVGRLKPGVTETQATADLSVIERQIHNEHSKDPFIFQTADVRPLLDDVVGDLKTPLYTLFAATICVLLIACLNIGNLLVARAATRRKEMAIRVALGGGRLRVLREQLIESFLVSVTGGVGGLGLAYSLIRWLVHTRQDISRIEATHIDGPVLAFSLGVMLFCAIFAALVASLSSGSGQVLVALQESSRSHRGGQSRAKLRKLLVSLEVALTVTLLVAAGLLLKSYERLRSTD